MVAAQNPDSQGIAKSPAATGHETAEYEAALESVWHAEPPRSNVPSTKEILFILVFVAIVFLVLGVVGACVSVLWPGDPTKKDKENDRRQLETCERQLDKLGEMIADPNTTPLERGRLEDTRSHQLDKLRDAIADPDTTPSERARLEQIHERQLEKVRKEAKKIAKKKEDEVLSKSEEKVNALLSHGKSSKDFPKE